MNPRNNFFKNPQLNSLPLETSRAGYIQTLGNTLQVSPWHLHPGQLATDIHNCVVDKLARVDSTCTQVHSSVWVLVVVVFLNYFSHLTRSLE